MLTIKAMVRAMRPARGLAAITAAAGLAMMGSALPAQAGTRGHATVTPAVNFWPSPVPIIGSTLSNSSSTPNMTLKYGWTLYDPDGVCSANVQLYVPNSGWQTIWSFTGSATTTSVSSKYQWSPRVASYTSLSATATDCLGNTASDYGYVDPSLYQEGSATYSAGWASGSCSCWSGGGAFKSSTVGAKAHFSFSGRLVTFISDKGTNRGKAALYIDGVYKKTITLTSSTSVNRLLAWNSPYLSSGTHVLTVKVVSGRVDVDAFVTQ